MDLVTIAIRILVVEDETFIRFDAGDMLRAAGCDVLEAANADEAILLLERHPEVPSQGW